VVGLVSQRCLKVNADALDYGWTMGVLVNVMGFGGAWFAFASIFAGNSNLFMPGIPALTAGLTLSYASKRFADQFYYVYRRAEKSKREEHSLPEMSIQP
jgi:hypothetical protein